MYTSTSEMQHSNWCPSFTRSMFINVDVLLLIYFGTRFTSFGIVRLGVDCHSFALEICSGEWHNLAHSTARGVYTQRCMDITYQRIQYCKHAITCQKRANIGQMLGQVEHLTSHYMNQWWPRVASHSMNLTQCKKPLHERMMTQHQSDTSQVLTCSGLFVRRTLSPFPFSMSLRVKSSFPAT